MMKRLATMILITMSAAGAFCETVRMGQLGTDTLVETLGEAPAEVQLMSKANLIETLSNATNGLLRAEAATLATVTARGATTTNAITAQNFIGGRYGVGAGAGASGTGWGAYGVSAGAGASGIGWGAYGVGAGSYASGDDWGAYGVDAGSFVNGTGWGAYGVGAGSSAIGNEWGAYGRMAGYGADHNNSHAFGHWAGYLARGDSRLYIDVYAAAPAYAPDEAINDRIFGDSDGKLYLGRGEGAPGGAVGGTLRGPWTGGGFATASVVTGIVERLTTSLSHPYILQGSTVVPLLGATLTLSGNAQHGPADTIQLIPWQATRPTEGDSLGTLTITSLPTEYIVDILADIHVTPLDPNEIPVPNNDAPVTWRSKRVSDTEWQVSAWAPGGPDVNQPLPGAGYYATLSNLVVQTFDRPGYWPNTITNDTAALPIYTDTTDIRKADPRRIPTTSGVRDYVESRKREIAQYAWRLTPSGKVAPSPNFVTMDLPLIQQGNVAFLQQGNYYVMSYEGGDWRSESTGSSWQIGASGRADLKITAESRMGHIRDFIRTADTCMIYASTNWMAAASTNGTAAGADPYIEWTYTLDNPQWLDSPDAVRSYHTDAVNGDYYLFTIACDAPSMFFRVMIPGSERRIISAPTHKFLSGIELGDDLLTDLLAAKADKSDVYVNDTPLSQVITPTYQTLTGLSPTITPNGSYVWNALPNTVNTLNVTGFAPTKDQTASLILTFGADATITPSGFTFVDTPEQGKTSHCFLRSMPSGDVKFFISYVEED